MQGAQYTHPFCRRYRLLRLRLRNCMPLPCNREQSLRLGQRLRVERHMEFVPRLDVRLFGIFGVLFSDCTEVTSSVPLAMVHMALGWVPCYLV